MDDVICLSLSISSIVVSLWLAGCLAKSTVIGWQKYYGGGGLGVDKYLCGAQQTGFDLMLFQYWLTANGAGPTLKQHRVKSSSLQGELSAFGYTRAVCVWLEQATQSSVYIEQVKTRSFSERFYLITTTLPRFSQPLSFHQATSTLIDICKVSI